MTEPERAQIEAALKAAYEKGFHDARYYPNRRQPAVRIDWGQDPHLIVVWDSAPATGRQVWPT